MGLGRARSELWSGWLLPDMALRLVYSVIEPEFSTGWANHTVALVAHFFPEQVGTVPWFVAGVPVQLKRLGDFRDRSVCPDSKPSWF